ncbi:MAG: pentapeptide repeat-containing protein [Rhodobacteraceae bacterium]|nr:pentapeptide repeat-containing protein [Paracoccaceae bacterium]
MVKRYKHFKDYSPQWRRRLLRAALSRQKPPEAPKNDTAAQIARINELSKTARATWLSLLGYLAFVGVTLLGVEDADFFVPSRQTQLPLIDVAIPTVSFFLFAPVLGAALFSYLHFQLLKLWEALRVPDPQVDGKPLSDHLAPWLITDMGLFFRFNRALRKRHLNWLSIPITIVLVFFAPPFVLGWFWYDYWPTHNLANTLIIGGAFFLSILVASTSLSSSISLEFKRATELKFRLNFIQLSFLFVLIAFTSWMKTAGPEKIKVDGNTEYRMFGVKAWQWVVDLHDPRARPEANLGNSVFMLAPADIEEVELIPKPANWRDYDTAKRKYRQEWCKAEGLKPEVCGPLPTNGEEPPPHQKQARRDWAEAFGLLENGEPDKQASDFFADLETQFLADWKTERRATIEALPNLNLSKKDLRNASASLSFLPGTDLREARLEGTYFIQAFLERANLRNARLEGAHLNAAQMEGADLKGVWLVGADVSFARLEGADLSGAHLEEADFSSARLEGADLSFAQLQGADLTGAWLEGAILIETRLDRADLRWAQLDGKSLRGARLEGADLSEVQLEGADLSDARLEGQTLARHGWRGRTSARRGWRGRTSGGHRYNR